jgi:hypothetical protein
MGLCWYRAGIGGSCLASVTDSSTRHCLPSLRRLSYRAPQSSLSAMGTTFISSMKYTHTMPLIAPSVLWCTDAHRNVIEATWTHVKVYLRPYWENEKCVMCRIKGSLSAEFDDDPEWNVKPCLFFISIPSDNIFHLSFLIGYFPDIQKTTIMQLCLTNMQVLCSVLFAVLKIFETSNFPYLLKECSQMHII